MAERRLSNWLEGFLKYCEDQEPPMLFKKWVGIAVLSSSLQRRCWMTWEAPIYPNMYIVIIGPSGTRKGTAMRPGYQLLKNNPIIRMSAEATTREALIRKLKNINDMTEIDGLPYAHSSMTVWSQEMTVFLGYKNEQLLTDLTDWYDCRDDWTYETKNFGTDAIQNLCVTMVGATVPDMLQHALPPITIGGGLTSRIIFVYGDTKSCINPAPFETPAQKRIMEDLQHDLDIISQLKGEFKFTPGYLERRVEWYIHQQKNPPFLDPKFWGYLERRATHQTKLAMIMSAARDNSMILDEAIFEQSVSWLEECEQKMERIYKGYGRRDTAALMDKILTVIAMSPGKKTTMTNLMKRFQNDLDTRELRQIISAYVKIGALRVEPINGTHDAYVVHIEDGN